MIITHAQGLDVLVSVATYDDGGVEGIKYLPDSFISNRRAKS